MNKILFTSLLLIFGFIANPFQVNAKITTAQLEDVRKVNLTYGYRGVFCRIENPEVDASNLLTVFLGDAPSGYYNALYEKTNCSQDTKEILIGETSLEYIGGYSKPETFFILDEKMYRAGDRFFSYYEDKNTGASYSAELGETITGLNVIGSSYFFESEYDASATQGARLENSGYINHYNESGEKDWTLLVFENTVYKLTNVIKEERDVVLLESAKAPTPLPSQPPDLQTYFSEKFLFEVMLPSSYSNVQEFDNAVQFAQDMVGEGSVYLKFNSFMSAAELTPCSTNTTGNSVPCLLLENASSQSGILDIAIGTIPAKKFSVLNPLNQAIDHYIQTIDQPRLEFSTRYTDKNTFEQIALSYKKIDPLIDCGTEIMHHIYPYPTQSSDPAQSTQLSYPNLQCFIDAAATCTNARLTLSGTLTVNDESLGSEIIDATDHHAIYKDSNNACILQITGGKYSRAYTDPLIEEIRKKQDLNLSKMMGARGICKFTNFPALAESFRKYSGTEYSPSYTPEDEWQEKGECSGNYFTVLSENSEL